MTKMMNKAYEMNDEMAAQVIGGASYDDYRGGVTYLSHYCSDGRHYISYVINCPYCNKEIEEATEDDVISTLGSHCSTVHVLQDVGHSFGRVGDSIADWCRDLSRSLNL